VSPYHVSCLYPYYIDCNRLLLVVKKIVKNVVFLYLLNGKYKKEAFRST